MLIVGCNDSVIPTDGSITAIGAYAFVNCTSPESVTIPSTLTKIGMGIFGRCDNLKKIYYEGSEELWRGIEISEIDNDLDSVEIVFNWGY